MREPTWADKQLARISAQEPTWRIWYTLGISPRISWSAMPEGARVAAVITDDPDRLLSAIRDCESWLPAVIEETRGMLAGTPEHWELARETHTAQLEALLREQRRAMQTAGASNAASATSGNE
jgi:hypothetical protein